jgi:hypothetical protein
MAGLSNVQCRNQVKCSNRIPCCEERGTSQYIVMVKFEAEAVNTGPVA